MSNAEPTSPPRGGWISSAADVVRLLQLLVVIVIAAIVAFSPSGDQPDRRCIGATLVGGLMPALPNGIPEEILANIRAFAKRCEKDPDARHAVDVMTQALESNAVSSRVAAVDFGSIRTGPLAGFAEALRQAGRDAGETAAVVVPRDAPAAPSTTPTPPPQPKPAAKPEGWVAVGFVGDETSFDPPAGKTLATLAVGDEITAKTPVNLRHGAADWRAPLAVLPAKTKARIVEPPKTLPAGSLRQVWAHVRVE